MSSEGDSRSRVRKSDSRGVYANFVARKDLQVGCIRIEERIVVGLQ